MTLNHHFPISIVKLIFLKKILALFTEESNCALLMYAIWPPSITIWCHVYECSESKGLSCLLPASAGSPPCLLAGQILSHCDYASNERGAFVWKRGFQNNVVDFNCKNFFLFQTKDREMQCLKTNCWRNMEGEETSLLSLHSPPSAALSPIQGTAGARS